MMKLIVIGLILGIMISTAYALVRKRKSIAKIQLVIYGMAVLTVLFGFEVFFTSLAEYENKAGSMGLIIFSFLGLLMFVFSWNWDTLKKRIKKARDRATMQKETQELS